MDITNTPRKLKFRAWIGDRMEYQVMVGQLGSFFTYQDPNDSACAINTRYTDSTPIMQYTGFKDKNGKEIYDGDIIKFGTSLVIYEVIFTNGTSEHSCFNGWGLINIDSKLRYHLNDRNFYEIIGNIYENPELIK